MEKDIVGNIVQALPIHENTFVGIATNENIQSGTVHLNEDGDITFHFADTDDIVVTAVKAGMDFQVNKHCTGITSTASIIIS